MAGTFHRAGVPTTVWNRDRVKADAVGEALGISVESSAAAASAAADIVISSLADDVAVKNVYLGSDGIAAGIRESAIVIDTSTIDPETSKEIGDAIDSAGAGFLDCPVSGDVSLAETGSLTMMAGGDPELLERATPVLDALAARIIYVGGRGSGAATKLAVNGLLHGLNVALSEAIVLAERAGVDRRTAYEVFAGGAGGAPYVQYKRKAFEDPDEAPLAFNLQLVAKDLELITGLGERVGLPMAQANTGLDIVRRAIEGGYGEKDLSAIAVFLREGDL